MDNNKTVLLVLLDLGAVFESINFDILLNRMEHMFAIVNSFLLDEILLDWTFSATSSDTEEVKSRTC